MADFMAGIGKPNHPSRELAASRLAGCASVLDIGCGPAVFYRTLQHRFGEKAPIYFGVDAVATMFDHAPEEARPALRIQRAEDLACPDESFQGVLLRHVLEHLDDPRDALTEAVRVTGRDLVIVFSQWTNDRQRLLTDTHLRAARFSHVGGHLLNIARPLELIARFRWTPTGLRDAIRNEPAQGANLAPREELWHLSRRPVESLGALELARARVD